MVGQGLLDTDRVGWKGLAGQGKLDRGIAVQRRLNTDRDGWTEKAEH
jgi:hypothetical protein